MRTFKYKGNIKDVFSMDGVINYAISETYHDVLEILERQLQHEERCRPIQLEIIEIQHESCDFILLLVDKNMFRFLHPQLIEVKE